MSHDHTMSNQLLVDRANTLVLIVGAQATSNPATLQEDLATNNTTYMNNNN